MSVILFALFLFLAGCVNKIPTDMVRYDPDAIVEHNTLIKSSNKISSKIKFKPKELSDTFEVAQGQWVPQDTLDSKDFIYCLANGNLIAINKKTKHTRISKLQSNKLNKIVKLGSINIFAYEKYNSCDLIGYNLLFKNQTVHRFGGFISNVIPYNKYLLVILTNGTCICYDHMNKKDIWSNSANTHPSSSLRSSDVWLDNLIFIDKIGRLVCVDVDNGETRDYVSIGKTFSNSKISIKSCKNGFCGKVDNQLLVGYLNEGKIRYTTVNLPAIESIDAIGEYIILHKNKSYVLTTPSLLANSGYISEIPRNSYAISTLIIDDSFVVVEPKLINIYNISSGSLRQAIELDRKASYAGSIDNQIGVFFSGTPGVIKVFK